jgi:CDP-glucose 4,6-dehydratase
MENMVMEKLFGGVYNGKKVFLTGHSGFKGSWLFLWLQKMGAIVQGYSLRPEYNPSHISLLNILTPNSIGDILDEQKLSKAVESFQPDLIFHLAAQPLVRKSYNKPIETFSTNILGTAHVLNAAKNTPSVKAIVNITTDKVYADKYTREGYIETDQLGGHDPYSTSKACVELVHDSYRKSFFKELGILSATVRAGNVIGGGDWAKDRLIPDIVLATIAGQVISIRNPESVRPWQHVLDPLSGYLLLGQFLLEGRKEKEGSWNFGPNIEDCISVKGILAEFSDNWKELKWVDNNDSNQPHESAMLLLNCAKAHDELGWQPVWNIKDAIAETAKWYHSYYFNGQINSIKNLETYICNAEQKKAIWID